MRQQTGQRQPALLRTRPLLVDLKYTVPIIPPGSHLPVRVAVVVLTNRVFDRLSPLSVALSVRMLFFLECLFQDY